MNKKTNQCTKDRLCANPRKCKHAAIVSKRCKHNILNFCASKDAQKEADEQAKKEGEG